MAHHSKQAETSGKSSPRATNVHSHGNNKETDSMGLERLVFFSDAVFAIAITLLALEIRLPAGTETLTNGELLSQLLALTPKYLGYCISFLVIGSFWITHHHRFRFITGYNDTLLFVNLLLLMVIAFVPFPTSVLSEYGNRTATIFYASTMVFAGFLSAWTWWYAVRNNRFVPADFTAAERRRGLVRSLIMPVVFLLSIGIAFINDDAAKYSWLLIIPASMFIH